MSIKYRTLIDSSYKYFRNLNSLKNYLRSCDGYNWNIEVFDRNLKIYGYYTTLNRVTIAKD